MLELVKDVVEMMKDEYETKDYVMLGCNIVLVLCLLACITAIVWLVLALIGIAPMEIGGSTMHHHHIYLIGGRTFFF